MPWVYMETIDLLKVHYIQRGTEVSGGDITDSLSHRLWVQSTDVIVSARGYFFNITDMVFKVKGA